MDPIRTMIDAILSGTEPGRILRESARTEEAGVYRIRALSLKQPWANHIAAGRKTIETRKWRTPYRGPLLIVSSRKTAIEPAGQAVAVCRLVGCRPMTAADEKAAMCPLYEKAQAWILEDIRSIEPFPVRGSLGLFTVELPEVPEWAP